MKFDEDNKLKWMSKIPFERHGLIGVDVKSHQTKTIISYPTITKGNDIHDRNCEDVKYWPKIADIKIPNGGSLVYPRREGCMVTGPTNNCIRSLLKQRRV